MSVNSESRESRERRLKGQWWLPDYPEHRVGGTLEFVPGEGGHLDLQGGLGAVDDVPQQSVIFGHADGKSLTIADAYLSGSRIQGFGPDAEVTEQSWRCFTVFIGRHEQAGVHSTFDTFDLRTMALSRWVEREEIINVEREPWSTSVQLQVPKSVVADIPDVGEVTLWWSYEERWSGGSVGLAVAPCLTFRPIEGMTAESAWQSFVTPMVFFLALVTGGGDRVVEIKAGRERGAGDWPESLELLSPVWARDLGDTGLPNPWEHPVPFDLAKGRFQEVLRAWFTMHHRTHSSLLDYFTTRFSPFMYEEETFIRVIRSVEAWHRAAVGGTYMPPEDFESFLLNLKACFGGEELRFATMRLKYANARTLKQRLDEMIEMAGEPLHSLLANYDRFSRRAVDTRNAIVHNGDKGNSFSDAEFYWARVSLAQVFEAVLLRRLGLSESEVSEAITHDGRWRGLSGPYNVLAAP